MCCIFDHYKEYDSVPHTLLIHKLKNYNIHQCTLEWMMNYLSNRNLYVCVSGLVSDTLPVSSGVWQGSVLSTLLFDFYISDITDTSLSNGSLLLYADDTML